MITWVNEINKCLKLPTTTLEERHIKAETCRDLVAALMVNLQAVTLTEEDIADIYTNIEKLSKEMQKLPRSGSIVYTVGVKDE